MNQTLFSARLTEDQPPRLSVEFGQGNSFQKDGGPCSAKVTVNATRQIRVHLGNKTVVNEAVGNLVSAQDCGRSLILRQASHNSYDYVHDNEDSEGENLSQVTLQLRGANLVAAFQRGTAAPVVPVMPGALPAAKAPVTVQAPVIVSVPVPVAAAASQPTVTPLRGDLPQGIWNNKRLLGTAYKDYQWYANNPNRPSFGKDQADYDLLYPIFLKEEGLYATLQEKLKSAAALNKLTGCLSEDATKSAMRGRTGSSERDIYAAYPDYTIYVNNPHRPSGDREQYGYDQAYPTFLQAERDYLTQKAKNEYNSAS